MSGTRTRLGAFILIAPGIDLNRSYWFSSTWRHQIVASHSTRLRHSVSLRAYRHHRWEKTPQGCSRWRAELCKNLTVITQTCTQKRDLQLAATHLHFNRGTEKKWCNLPDQTTGRKITSLHTSLSLCQIVCCLAPLMRDPHCNAQDTRALYIPPPSTPSATPCSNLYLDPNCRNMSGEKVERADLFKFRKQAWCNQSSLTAQYTFNYHLIYSLSTFPQLRYFPQPSTPLISYSNLCCLSLNRFLLCVCSLNLNVFSHNMNNYANQWLKSHIIH